MENTSSFSPMAAFLRLKEEVAGPPYHRFLQPVAEAVTDSGEVRIRLAYRLEFSGSPKVDFFHGGIIASLIDLAAYAAVAVQTGRPAPTIDLRIDYLRPAEPPGLTAYAAVLKLGFSVTRADVRILDDRQRLVAVGRGSFNSLDRTTAS